MPVTSAATAAAVVAGPAGVKAKPGDDRPLLTTPHRQTDTVLDHLDRPEKTNDDPHKRHCNGAPPRRRTCNLIATCVQGRPANVNHDHGNNPLGRPA